MLSNLLIDILTGISQKRKEIFGKFLSLIRKRIKFAMEYFLCSYQGWLKGGYSKTPPLELKILEKPPPPRKILKYPPPL